MAACVWNFYRVHIIMLMHVVAHVECTDTVREFALEVDSGRKILCLTGDSNPCQYCAWFTSRMLYPLSYLCPTALKLEINAGIIDNIQSTAEVIFGQNNDWQRLLHCSQTDVTFCVRIELRKREAE